MSLILFKCTQKLVIDIMGIPSAVIVCKPSSQTILSEITYL